MRCVIELQTDDLIGKLVDCSIVNVIPSRAFLKIEGIDEKASIYIGEITGDYIKDIDNHFKIGDEIKAIVLSFDKEHGYQLTTKDLI